MRWQARARQARRATGSDATCSVAACQACAAAAAKIQYRQRAAMLCNTLRGAKLRMRRSNNAHLVRARHRVQPLASGGRANKFARRPRHAVGFDAPGAGCARPKGRTRFTLFHFHLACARASGTPTAGSCSRAQARASTARQASGRAARLSSPDAPRAPSSSSPGRRSGQPALSSARLRSHDFPNLPTLPNSRLHLLAPGPRRTLGAPSGSTRKPSSARVYARAQVAGQPGWRRRACHVLAARFLQAKPSSKKQTVAPPRELARLKLILTWLALIFPPLNHYMIRH